MTQPNGTMNLVIRDSTGKQQVIQVLQNPKPFTQIANLNGQTIKLKPINQENGSSNKNGVTINGSQVLRTLVPVQKYQGSRIIQIPMSSQQMETSRVKLQPQLLANQNVKFVNASTGQLQRVNVVQAGHVTAPKAAIIATSTPATKSSIGRFIMTTTKSATSVVTSASSNAGTARVNGGTVAPMKMINVAGSNFNKVYISTLNEQKTRANVAQGVNARKRSDEEATSSLQWGGKQSTSVPQPTEFKRRRGDKTSKGLRHFSMKVCEKVRRKGTTSYNEVADELVNEFTNQNNLNGSTEQVYDQKNIRRRVYDALNVLMAMNIISKDKKEIRWIGLPTNTLQECLQLEKEKQLKIDSIKQKQQKLRDLIYQQISFKNLVERNRAQQDFSGVPPLNSTIPLPFIIINTNKKTAVECSISSDKREYDLTFDDKFQIHDDIEVLKRIGMLRGLDSGDVSDDDIAKLKKTLPKSLENYVEDLARGVSEPSIDGVVKTWSERGPATDYLDTQMSGDTELTEFSQMSSYSDMSNAINEFSDVESESMSTTSDADVQ